MDAFFASVEQRDFPELRGKPVAVGGNKDRGVIAAASYEARKYGVKSAMSSKMAYIKCPHLIFKPARFDAYKEVSNQIHEIFSSYTDLIEPLSLDEAYLDVTENKKGIKSATKIANEIRAEIYAKTGLTASAGISCNKFVAKMASDINKPNGYCLVTPEEVVPFIEQLEIKRFYGIGKVTAAKFFKMGILFGKDLKKLSEAELTQHFGKAGKHYYLLARGIDNRNVIANRIRKSVGAEHTFDVDLHTVVKIEEQIENIANRVWSRLTKSKKEGKTVTLKIKFSDFNQITRSKTLLQGMITSEKQIQSICKQLLVGIDIGLGVRLVGISINNFKEPQPKSNNGTQLTLQF
jgi:DNA polymerase-4